MQPRRPIQRRPTPTLQKTCSPPLFYCHPDPFFSLLFSPPPSLSSSSTPIFQTFRLRVIDKPWEKNIFKVSSLQKDVFFANVAFPCFMGQLCYNHASDRLVLSGPG